MAEWTKDQIIARIRGEADAQKVDPDLAVAVATQESYLNPNARGDNGNSIGLFQLQPAAAIDVGVNPKWRQDPGVNIYGGVRYLKQKLDQSKGDVPQALRRYNGGGDPNYVQNVMRFFKPGVAEAAERPQASGTYSDSDVQHALKALQGAQEPQTPQGGTYGEEDIQAALKALGDTPEPPPASQTAPTQATPPGASQGPPAPDTSWTPGMRFQALPSITQLEPADRAQKTKLFESLDPKSQEEFLRAEEPPSDLTVDIEKPSAASLAVGGGPARQAPPVTDPAALLAVGGRPQAPSTNPDQQARVREELAAWEKQAGRPWREGDPRMPSEKKLGVPDEAPVTEGITAPSTMVPLLMPGAGLKLAAGPIKALPSLLQRGARPVVEGLSQTAGWTAGRTAETGEVPSPGEIGKEAALNVATGGLVEIPVALQNAKNAALRATPGAQILLKNRAVQEAEGLGKRVFNAEDKAVVGKAFDAVIATGEKLDTSPVRTLWQSLTPAEQRIAGNELGKISSSFADALKTKKLGDWDIGDLQHLRSELRTAGLSKRTPETQDLLQSLRASVDEAIHNGMAKGSLPAADLIAAQQAYRKVMQAEDLQGLVRRYTKDSPNLKYQELNLAGLNKEIRGGGKKSTQRLIAGMDATERQVLQDELAALAKRYPFVRVASTVGALASAGGLVYGATELMSGDTKGASVSLLPAIVHAATRSPRFMGLFKRSILDGKGQLAKHHVDALVNAIRHENEGETPVQ